MDRFGKQLQALRVSGRHARALLLLPLVYVGWASRRRDGAQLDALLEFTARRVGLPTPCLTIARSWLLERPTRAQFQRAFALLRALHRAPGNPLITHDDLQEAIRGASQAAQLDREPVAQGDFAPIGAAVRRALHDVEAWLEVDSGDVLGDLLADGEADGRAAGGIVPPPAEAFADLSDTELENATSLLDVGADDEYSAVLVRRSDAAALRGSSVLEGASVLERASAATGAARVRGSSVVDASAGARAGREPSSPGAAPFPLVRRSR